MIVALVYKSGGDFDVRHVDSLVNQLRLFGQYKGSICCLTDQVEEVRSLNDPEPLRLQWDWPGWWSKIELFKSGLFKDCVLYLDLDNFVFNDLFDLMRLCQKEMKPLFLRGVHPKARMNDWLASGIMSWQGNQLSVIYDAFVKKGSTRTIREQEKVVPGAAGQRGDQGFIRSVLTNADYEFFQDNLPNKRYILFKRHIMMEGQNTNDCHVLCWSGNPRQHSQLNPFNRFWKSCLSI